MASLLLSGLRIIRPGSEQELIPEGWILVDDGLVAALGTNSDRPPAADSSLDMQGRTVLPGLINAHTHLYSTLALGMPAPANTPRNFTEILERVWWKLDRALDEPSVSASFRAGLLECLRWGVTTVIDHHSSPSWITGSLTRLQQIADEVGPRVATAFELSDRNGTKVATESLKENLDTAKRGHARHASLLGLHASFTLDDSTLADAARLRRKANTPGIHIHLAEDLADQTDAYKRKQPGVVARLDAFGLLDEHALVIHGLHLRRDELQLLEQRKCCLVHNPGSNANNRVGSLGNLAFNTCLTGLGTDGMQANMLAEAKEGTLIASAVRTLGTPSVDYLRLLFQNNPLIASRIFGREIGRIEPGQPADLVFHDYRERTPVLPQNLSAHLLFGLEKPSDVYCDGRFRIRDGHVTELDETAILKDARTRAADLWQRMAALT